MVARIALPLFLLFTLCCFCLPLHAQEDRDGTEFVIDGFKLETLPGGYYYPNFIENLAPDAVWLSEESNGFGLLDRPRVYFEGDSWTQFNWRYAGHSLNSALDDGSPALRLPFLAIGAMSLHGETPQRRDYGLSFSPRSPAGKATRVMLSTAFPNLGGYTWLGKLALGNHASKRADNLYETRRRLDGNLQLDFAHERSAGASALLLAGGYLRQERRFNDFNERDRQFEEEGESFQLLGRWQRRFAAGALDLDLVFNAGRRGNLFAEDGRYPQETYSQDSRSWLAGAAWSGGIGRLKLSWLHERQQRLPVVGDFGKDLQDIDGQSIFPFEKWGVFSADTLALDAEREFAFSWLKQEVSLKPFLELSAAFRSASERTGEHHEIYFAGAPYLACLWQGSGAAAYRNQRQRAAAGTLLRMDLGRRVAFNARLFLLYQGLGFKGGANDRHFLQPGGEAGFSVRAGKRTELSLSFGILPYEMGSGAGDFLEPGRPTAAVHHWADANGDGRFQDGEQGALFALSGGASHAAAASLKPSLRQRLELLLTTRLSANFSLDIKGLYKWIRRPLWASFAEEYGRTHFIDGREYYLLDRPVTGFELGNAPFARDPFYAQFLVRVHGAKARRWYFSFSFLAHMGMGTTAFGNGPEANDIGVIAESQAFPNSWINGFGRVDGDRAFVGKVFFGYHLSRRLFLGGSVKYRDGAPFAFLDAFRHEDQRVITYQTIKAEDNHGRKGGPREDCVWDFNFKLGYDVPLAGGTCRLELSLFNLLDFGSELSENAFSGGARLANELQLPRSLRLGLVLEF
ncbi:MAG: hypothetical protein MUF02_00945 [Acidobacteria bacterium]|nr:hypothetical protein [Acidobacteriota bacterium]